MSTTMEEKPVSGSSQINPLGHLTRQQLKELEQKEKTRGQKILDLVIMLLPVICGFIAVIEYWEVPNGSPNSHPYTYVWAVAAFMTAYALYALAAGIKYRKGDRRTAEDLRYRAPLFSAFFLLLTFYDYLTLKTGILSQPFVPCMNSILNIAWEDRAYLLECTLHTLRLLFLGYFIGIALGLVTGITCGYSEKARYWINPVIKFLGPIPTATWIPIIMVVAAVTILNSIYPFLFDACSQKTFEMTADELIKGNSVALPDMDPSGKNPHSFALSEKEDKERESSGQSEGMKCLAGVKCTSSPPE